MPLSDEHVREILRLIDDAEEDELSAETEAFRLYVRSEPGPARVDGSRGGRARAAGAGLARAQARVGSGCQRGPALSFAAVATPTGGERHRDQREHRDQPGRGGTRP